jgi:hypothetical protein
MSQDHLIDEMRDSIDQKHAVHFMSEEALEEVLEELFGDEETAEDRWREFLS